MLGEQKSRVPILGSLQQGQETLPKGNMPCKVSGAWGPGSEAGHRVGSRDRGCSHPSPLCSVCLLFLRKPVSGFCPHDFISRCLTKNICEGPISKDILKFCVDINFRGSGQPATGLLFPKG